MKLSKFLDCVGPAAGIVAILALFAVAHERLFWFSLGFVMGAAFAWWYDSR